MNTSKEREETIGLKMTSTVRIKLRVNLVKFGKILNLVKFGKIW